MKVNQRIFNWRRKSVAGGVLRAIVVLCHVSLVWAQTPANPCDLNRDGAVNSADASVAVNMALGAAPCTANIRGANVCDATVVQRVVNAATGGACVTGSGQSIPHSVTLNWVASTSPSIAGYRIHRGAVAGGPYTPVNASLVSGTSFVDNTVLAGVTYYYVVTSVNTGNQSSASSNETRAVVPSP